MQMHIKWHIDQCSADFGFVVRLELAFFVVFVFSFIRIVVAGVKEQVAPPIPSEK